MAAFNIASTGMPYHGLPPPEELAVGGTQARSPPALRHALPLDVRDRTWLLLALLPAGVAVAIYLGTNPYPAYGSGLYTKIAERIVANGYAPPARIPGYTADGVPFAYPPLQFYLLGVLLDLGGDPIAIARFLPSVAVLGAQVPIYLLARDVTGSRPGGAVAAALVALNPQVLEWHISAGGIVRAFAFLYALTAIYAGYHVFTSGDRRAVGVGLSAFGLTVLTHPTYTLFVVVSYLLFWGVLDRSLDGLARGATVGIGGAVLASPWFGWAVVTHGPGVFTAAAGTHGGIGGGAAALLGDVSLLGVVPFAGVAYLLARRRFLLPIWFIAAEMLFKQPRFAYTVGALVFAAVGLDIARRRPLSNSFEKLNVDGPDRRAVAATLLVLVGTLGGGAYLAYEMTLTTDPTTPEFLDDEAVDALAWAATEPPEDATFVVLGDAAEWFPALTDRTILVGPWGVEWEDAGRFDRQLDTYDAISACRHVSCVEDTAATVGAAPDYVYVPKGQYTIRGEHAVQSGALEGSFDRSARWVRAFENDGVVVYRRTDVK